VSNAGARLTGGRIEPIERQHEVFPRLNLFVNFYSFSFRAFLGSHEEDGHFFLRSVEAIGSPSTFDDDTVLAIAPGFFRQNSNDDFVMLHQRSNVLR
jgi:hypothetical protein